MRIGLCYNVKPKKTGKFGVEVDYDDPSTIRGIRKAIELNGHEVTLVRDTLGVFNKLRSIASQIDLIFNVAEGVPGDARESQIPLFCEMLGIHYTHSSPTVHALSLDKNLTKLAVSGLGVKVPRSLMLSNELLVAMEETELAFPMIIKPNKEGSSSGVFSENIVDDEVAMEKRIKQLRKMGLGEDLLVEEFIDGREFTVAVWGNELPEVLPIVEQKFGFMPKGLRKIAGYELKWIYEDRLKDFSKAYACPARLTDEKTQEIERISKVIYRGLGIRDVARLDYRMDKEGRVYFLEVNTLPGMIPGSDIISYFPRAAAAAGFSYEQMVGKIIDLAKKRYNVV
jgi:D-alanine-D-alanine ligase